MPRLAKLGCVLMRTPPPAAADLLFAAGAGVMPPHLAGREQERELLSRYLSALWRGQAPPSDVILIGPRGSGKTVLLRWFAGACRDAGVEVVDIAAPSDLKTGQELREALLPSRWFRRLRAASWLGAKVELAPPHAHKEVFMNRLAARCRRKPRVVLVDEAHTLNREVGQYLLDLSQYVRQAPFLLVLAGTPGLPAHLRSLDASFWDRSRQLGIGRLDHAAAKEALARPLAERGRSIEADPLDAVANHSQRYAYFLQIWGEELWEACRNAETPLTITSVAEVREQVERRMADYYSQRYRELENLRLLPAARAVAPVFQDGLDATATDQDLDDALATTYETETERLAAREQLNELGYIWCPPGEGAVAWHAGIPALMRYVLDAGTSR